MSPELSHVFTELVVVLLGAAAAALVFQTLRLPLVLGYIVAGLVVGPNVTGAVAGHELPLPRCPTSA